MSSNFEFLKEYSKTAYSLAKSMERTLYTEPVGALAFGGRFLELIRNKLYQYHYKEMNKVIKSRLKTTEDLDIKSESFKRADLTDHISSLYHNKIIKSHESNKIIAAYNIRHNLHLNEDIDDINSDKEAALKLYKEIFEIAKWYCNHIDNTFDADIEFSYPSESDYEDQIPEVNIAKIFDDCVICGKENISSNRNICPECKRKIRLGSDLDDLMDLLNDDNRFTKNFLKRQSYDTYEIDYMMHFLREFDLRSSETKDEIFINYDKAYEFIEETKSYEEIEKILLAFYNELIDEDDIDYSENSFYRLGERGHKLYSQYYLLIITKKIKNYLNYKSKNIPNACEKSGVTIDEISYWYDRKVKNLIKLNYKKDLDISFNHMSRILMDKWIEYRENKENKADIKNKLKLTDRVLGFWLDDSLISNSKYPYIKEFIFKNREIEMKLFVEGLSLGLNKNDAIEFADTNIDFVDKYFNLSEEDVLIKRWRIGKQANNEESFKRYKNIYFHKTTKEFLEHLIGNTIDDALLKSTLDEGDFNKWYNAGKKEFHKYNCDLDSDLYKFYIKTTKTLMNNWLDERRLGHKRLESCKNIGLYSDTLDEWFKFKEDEPRDFEDKKYNAFKDFYIKSDEITMNLIMESIENGDNKTVAAKKSDSSVEMIDSYLKLGKENDENYTDFYEKYEEIYLPKRREEFLKLFEKKEDFNKAVKASELSLEEIRFAYEKGENGEEEYIEFYEKLLDLKLRTYAKKLSLNEKEKRALEKSNLTKEELETYDYRIEILILSFNMGRVIRESFDKKLEKILNKSSISLNDVFYWYDQGKEQYELDENLEYLTDAEILGSAEETYEEYILKDKDYKDNPEKNLDSYYKNFYNLYHEHIINVRCRVISRFLYEGENLKTVLKVVKFSKIEFNHWDGLGLIKRGEEASKLVDERKIDEKIRKSFETDKWEECIEYIKKYFEINPQNRNYLRMQAICFEELEKYDEAIECYDKLIKMEHSYNRYWFNRAVVLNKAERYVEAIKSCKEADKLDPNNENYIGFIVSILIKLGKLEETLDTLSQTEKTIDIELSADDVEKVKEIIEDPSYKENIGQLKIFEDLDKYFDEEGLKGLILDIEDLDEFLDAKKTGELPDWEEK